MPRFSVPQHLFAPDTRACRDTPATAADIRWTERELGVKLPAAYKALLRVRNGGSFRLTRFDLPRKVKSWPWKHYFVSDVPGVGKQKWGTLTQLTQLARDEWGYPSGLIPLCGDGHSFCCLDYRKCGPDGEPVVVHFEVDPRRSFVVAPSVETLIGGLYRDQEEWDPALIALDAGAPRTPSAIDLVLLGLGMTRYKYAGAKANPKYPLPPTWKWKKYRGLLKGEPVWVKFERNKIYPTSLQKSDARPERHPMLTVSVEPEHEDGCLGEIVTALGKHAVVLRGAG